MRIGLSQSSSLHPALVPRSHSANQIASLAQRAYYENSRAAVTQLAARLTHEEAELHKLEAEIESFTANRRNTPELKRLNDVRTEIGLLESRLDNERLKAGDAKAQTTQYADQIKQLKDKVERKKSNVDAIRSQISAPVHARNIGDSQQHRISGIPQRHENASGSTSSASSAAASAAMPSFIPSSKTSEAEQPIADLTKKLNMLLAEGESLRREAADIKKQSEETQKTQQTSETRRKKQLHPARINTLQMQQQHQAELLQICSHWGMQPPRSEKSRETFFDKIMERVTERTLTGDALTSAGDEHVASTSQGTPVPGSSTQLQFKPEITQEESGVLKAVMLLNAYIHPVRLDISIQEKALATALGLAKRFADTHSLANNEELAAEKISECAELAVAVTQSQIAAYQDELEKNAINQTYKFCGTHLRKKPREALAQKYGQLGDLALRHRHDLTRDMKTRSVELLAKQLDIGDLQFRLRSNTAVDVVKLQADLLENQVRQTVNQAERSAVMKELEALRKEHDATAADTTTPGGSVVPPALHTSSSEPSMSAMLPPETRLSASTGKLQELEEELGTRIQAHETAENDYRAADSIIGETRRALTEKRAVLEQLQQQESERSTVFRQLLAQRNPLRERINIETERIKKDPAITKLISETALSLVLARHIDQSDHNLVDRSFVVGRSGTYASFSVFLRALVEVHRDATERFSDMMHAPSVGEFETAKRRREVSGERINDVTFRHAERVGWAFHADEPKRDTRIQSNASAYSMAWYGSAGPVISHIYPSTRDK